MVGPFETESRRATPLPVGVENSVALMRVQIDEALIEPEADSGFQGRTTIGAVLLMKQRIPAQTIRASPWVNRTPLRTV